MPTTDTPTTTTTSPVRFTLDTDRAAEWLRHAVAAYTAAIDGEEPPADLMPAPGIRLPGGIGREWDPTDADESTQVWQLVHLAAEGGIIHTPRNATVSFEFVADENCCGYYWFTVRVGGRLALTSHAAKIELLTEHTTGAAAALAVLEEAVRSANGVLDDLDGYITGRNEPAEGTLIAEDLVALATNLGLEPEDLDELVHDAAGQEASRVNNGGLDTQIEYLIDQLGPIAARAIIQDRAEETRSPATTEHGTVTDGHGNA